MTLPLIALRNLSRNRRRTVLSLLVVAAGSVAVLLTAGFVRFSFAGLQEAIIHGGLGHLEVLPSAHAGEGGLPDRTAAPAFADWRAVQEDVEALPVREEAAEVAGAGAARGGFQRRDHPAVLQVAVVAADPGRVQVRLTQQVVRVGAEIAREVREPLQGGPTDQRHVVQGQEDVVASQDPRGPSA